MYEGRGWNIKGDHTGPTWNTRAIGISFMGNFMGELGAVGSTHSREPPHAPLAGGPIF